MIKTQKISNLRDDQSLTQQKLNKYIKQAELGTQINLKNFQSGKRRTSVQNNPQIKQTASSRSSVNSAQCLVVSTISLKHSPNLLQISQFDTGGITARKQLRQNTPQLKQIITQQKIKIIVKNFIRKLSRNNINSKPYEFSPFQNQMQLSFLDTHGIQLHDNLIISLSIFSTLLIILLSIVYTLSIVFDEVNKTPLIQGVQAISLVFYFCEMVINFVTVKFQEGKRLDNLRQIWNYYAKNNLLTDAISIIIIFVDCFTDFPAIIYMRLFLIIKLGQGLDRIEKLQIFFIHNFYYQQYWSLIKVFLFNFSLAHVLAIFLIAMAGISPDDNWMNYKNIGDAPWIQRYIWAYYWATTMMLTVGFGDLAATNYKEAVILTLIEMISCMALAYNINCVGNLISNIRSQDLQKGKNFKIFHKLTRKNDLSQDLQWRINNYIQQSSNIKKKFNYEEENHFVEKLPKGLKTQFLKQSNKKIFQNLPFFKNLMERTLFSFAQKIEMHICHPEEIIQHIDDPHNLLILKGGQIGFTCKKPGCEYNSTVIDQLKIKNVAEPILVSLGFIRRVRAMYQIKSLQYSILYFLDHQVILSILKGSQMDYQLYCLLKDKSSHIPDEYELFLCEICSGRHTKFTCPKLHFIPIKQHVANKFIYKFKTGKCQRDGLFTRYQSKQFNSLKTYLKLNQFQSRDTKIFKNKKSNKITTNLLNNRKKFQQIEDTSNTLIREISDIKDFFSKNTAELIKNEMNKAFMYGEGQDDVWIVESDKMKNYKSYFQSDNSCNLVDKFSLLKRAGYVATAEDYWTQVKSRKLLGNSTRRQDDQAKSNLMCSFKLLGSKRGNNNKEEDFEIGKID